MIDGNLFFYICSLEKFLSASQLGIGYAIQIFRIFVKYGKNPMKFLLYNVQ